MNATRLLLLSFTLVAPLVAQTPDPSKFEPVLVPVFSAGSGAFGSQWVSSMHLLNSGKTAVDLAKPVLSSSLFGDDTCFITTATLRPKQPATLCKTVMDPSGVILYVPRTTAEDDKNLNFHLRVRDTSRSDQNAGTEVPVVRERNLRGEEPFWLLGVDTDDGYRVALRFYDILGVDGLPLTMRAYGREGLLLETSITLSQPIRTLAVDPFPLHPAYEIVPDLTALFPQLKGHGPLDIEIRYDPPPGAPPYPHKHLYAFASITNNATQVFTIVTPQ